MTGGVFDDRRCALGEGALWHPERRQLFWFDILGKRLLSRVGDKALEWRFDEQVSAAGWIDRDTLLVATESALARFDLGSGAKSLITRIEADDRATRSNDGRADPFGGFWIGTMGKRAEAGRGTIYRWYRGTLKPLFSGLTIPNAICFSPDGQYAYFADTAAGRIMRQALDIDGWPDGSRAELHVDLRKEGLNPDGAEVDAEGCLWNAQWGAARVARYSPAGDFLTAVGFPASQVSCPAFGGAGMTTLFATSAADGCTDEQAAGQTFFVDTEFRGQPVHRVEL